MTKTKTEAQPLDSDFQAWLNKELHQLEAVKYQNFRDKGYTPFYTFPEGKTQIELIPQQPVPNQTYSGNMNFPININGEDFMWSVNIHNRLYRQLLEAIQQGNLKLVVVRHGKGLDTRWNLNTR